MSHTPMTEFGDAVAITEFGALALARAEGASPHPAARFDRRCGAGARHAVSPADRHVPAV